MDLQRAGVACLLCRLIAARFVQLSMVLCLCVGPAVPMLCLGYLGHSPTRRDSPVAYLTTTRGVGYLVTSGTVTPSVQHIPGISLVVCRSKGSLLGELTHVLIKAGCSRGQGAGWDTSTCGFSFQLLYAALASVPRLLIGAQGDNMAWKLLLSAIYVQSLLKRGQSCSDTLAITKARGRAQ